MKLIVAGATGFVGTETTIQALKNLEITSVVALSRRPLELEEGVDTSKLTNIVLDDFDHYPDGAKKDLANADACIWTLAVTPKKAQGVDPAAVKHICHDHTFTGLDVMMQARGNKKTPLRFLYISGFAVRRDSTDVPAMVPEEMKPYFVMRCEVENALIAYAAKQPKDLEVCCARPGMITQPGKGPAEPPRPGIPSLGVNELAAAMLDQVINGFEKEPLAHDDLERIGKQVLQTKMTA